MPPKKVIDPSKVALADDSTPAKDGQPVQGINVEDLNLPKSIVTRLAKGVLPANTQIQGNAMLAMTKSATVFVNYLATHANGHAAASNRKTITPQDVLNALDDLEFLGFRERLEPEIEKFNEIAAEKRNAYKTKQASSKAAGQSQSKDDETDVEDGPEGQLDREGQPAAKKARLDMDSIGGAASEAPERDDDQTEDDDGANGTEAEEEEEQEERLEVEEPEEEKIQGEDEALDNGEDSD